MLAGVLSLSTAAQNAQDARRAVLDVGAAQQQLRTSDGVVFHTTPAAVRNLRTIRGPRRDTLLFLWDEQDAGGTSSFYAVSTDGESVTGRARSSDYRVRLLGLDVDPLRSVPLVAPSLRAPADNRLFLVQFHVPPLPEFRAAVEAQGVRVHRALPEHTFLVAGDAGRVAALSSLDVVRWIGPYHVQYRVAPELLGLVDAGMVPAARYSIMLIERGRAAQDAVGDFIRRIGGEVHVVTPEGFRMEATLTGDQLSALVRRNDVQYVDPWGGPGETDMNIVRQVGGANFIESTLGYTGQGVRGEIFDTELLTSHQEWGPAPIIHSSGTSGSLHGTSCYSINFATGASSNARGMCPDGQGIFFRYSESTQFGGGTSRYVINQQLLDPAGPYRAVFQTSSVGSARTTSYTSISAETDDYLFLHQVLSTQSQSNAGNRNSRPQAWAKNIVACGGIYHFGTVSLSDDSWNGGASIGPAADGRIKPDLAYFYDGIFSASGSGNTSYTNFGGTSAATPETAGHFGIFYQMWHQGVWSGFGGAASVFASRPKMATAKAMMINFAQRYDWNQGGANSDIDRNKQGWGLPNLQRLYDGRDTVLIVDETDLLAPFGTNTYSVAVAAGTPELRATLVYVDPMGLVGASQARVNDLSLRLTSPSGTTYWGNNGLTADNTSSAGGSSNTVDTVENVLLVNPEVGTWTVDVIGDAIVADSHLETGAVDADYALVVAGVGTAPPPTPPAAPTGLTAGANGQAIDLAWADNSGNEDRFEIERSTDGVSFANIANVAANVTSFVDSGLAANTYFYRVRAGNTAGVSGYTNTASATVLPGPVDVVASGESSTFGSVSGSYVDTTANDGVYESIQEVTVGGGRNGVSRLEHEWTFTGVPSTGAATFMIKAYQGRTRDNDNFDFEWSADGVSWNYLLTVSRTSDDGTYETEPIGTAGGTVMVRATDTNQENGKRKDRLYIDHMLIRVQ